MAKRMGWIVGGTVVVHVGLRVYVPGPEDDYNANNDADTNG